jgi:hypothetical protein
VRLRGAAGQEELLDSDTAFGGVHPNGDRRRRRESTRFGPVAAEATFRLSTGEALVAISLASLGLWAMIAAAVFSLAPALLQ